MPNNKSNISHWRTRTRPLINEIKKFDGPGATGTVTNLSTTTSYLLQSATSQGDLNDAYLQTLRSSLSEFVKKDRDGKIVSRILDLLEHAVLPEGHPSNPEDILFDNLIYQINKRLYAVFKDVQYRLDRIHDLPVILCDTRSLTDAARSLSTWTSNWLRVQETLSEVFGTLASVSDSSNIVTTGDDGLKARDSPFTGNPQQRKVSNSSHNQLNERGTTVQQRILKIWPGIKGKSFQVCSLSAAKRSKLVSKSSEQESASTEAA
jgi:hypothetical protein